MNTADIILLTIALLLILSFFVLYRMQARKHLPKEKLNAKQIEDITRYGVLHFTTVAGFAGIKESGMLKPGKPLFATEKGFVWVYPCGSNLQESVKSATKHLKRSRKHSIICIRLVGFTKQDCCSFRRRASDGAMVYSRKISIRRLASYASRTDGIFLAVATISGREKP